jgi:hypothetical protein
MSLRPVIPLNLWPDSSTIDWETIATPKKPYQSRTFLLGPSRVGSQTSSNSTKADSHLFFLYSPPILCQLKNLFFHGDPDLVGKSPLSKIPLTEIFYISSAISQRLQHHATPDQIVPDTITTHQKLLANAEGTKKTPLLMLLYNQPRPITLSLCPLLRTGKTKLPPARSFYALVTFLANVSQPSRQTIGITTNSSHPG